LLDDNPSQALKSRGRDHEFSSVLLVLELIAIFVLLPNLVLAQSDNVVLLANVDEYGAYSDVWGYSAPDGTELAIIGLDFGTSFIDVTDLDNPVEVLNVPGGYSVWRDIKTYGTYAYLVDDQAGEGLIVVDLSVPTAPVVVGQYTSDFTRAHNVWVDADLGLLFAGYDQFGDLHVLDVAANPANPPEVFVHTAFPTHDMYSRDGVGYMADIFGGQLRTVDLTQLPITLPELDSEATVDDATHNVWLTDSGNYALVSDEVATGHITVFDVSDPGDLAVVGSYVHPEDPGSIIHNVIIEDDIAYVAWYRAGLEVIDVSNPLSPTRLGYYDTFPGTGSGFDGAWGVYPFAESGNIYVSDIQTGLYVLQYSGSFGSVQGTLTDLSTTDPVPNAVISISALGRSTVSDSAGFYSLSVEEGTYVVDVTAFGYEPVSLPVEIVVDETTNGDVSLVPLPRGSLSGQVLSSNGGVGIAGAHVEILGTPLSTISLAGGLYSFPDVPAGSVVLRVKALGFGRKDASALIADGLVTNLDVTLDPSFIHYDLEIDPPGWTVGTPDDDATQGLWTRVDPNGTGDPTGSVQPEDDRTDSPGTHCFVTGQQTVGGSVGSNDVDGGRTTLLTDVYDLTSVNRPTARFYCWYVNDAGSNPGTDDFVVEISGDGGLSWAEAVATSESRPFWAEVEVVLEHFIAELDQVQFRFVAADEGGASVVEAGIDEFEIFGQEEASSAPLPPHEFPTSMVLPSSPNPFEPDSGGAIRFHLEREASVELDVIDVAGRSVARLLREHLPAGLHEVHWNARDQRDRPVPRGVYLAILRAGESRSTRKITIR